MRITRGIAALLLLALALATLAGCSSEDLVARVNGTDITRAEFDVIYQQILAQSGGELDEATAAEYKRQILDMMIDSTIITAEAEKLGADLSDEAVSTRLDSLMGGVDEATMNEQFEAAGVTIEDVHKSVRDQLASEFISEVASKESTLTAVPVAYSLLSHILVDDEALAKDLTAKARAGEDFAALASENSSDSASAVDGGSLGWAPTSDYVTEFADAADALKVGEISDPVKSDFGWHVILKQDEVAEGSPIADAPAELADILNATSGDLALKAYVAKLREAAEIEYLDETLKPVK